MPTRDVRSALIDSLLSRLAAHGRAGASARMVASDAGVSASAINYHFGDFEQLFCTAYESALDRARLWMDARVKDARFVAPLPPHAFSSFAAQVLERWTGEQTILAYAQVECGLAAGRSPYLAPCVHGWAAAWRDFWGEVLPLFGLDPDLAGVAAIILSTEAMHHLACWNPLLDRGGLEDFCVRLTARLSGDPELMARPSPWRERAEALSLEAHPSPAALPGPAARIARAAVAVTAAHGEAGLTHRAVAAEAGVSLGAVAHHFPTRTDLVGAAYTAVYDTGFGEAERVVARTARAGQVGDYVRAIAAMINESPQGGAFDELFVAATRNPDLAGFAARVRYSRGRGSLRLIAPQVAGLTRLDGVLISHWASGERRLAVLLGPGDRAARLAEIQRLAPRIFP